MLSLKNIRLKYSNQIILDQLDFQVNQGEFVVILGSNGSGKSSLLKLIDQRYTVQQGEILLDGLPLKNYSQVQRSKLIVTLSQHPLESLFPHLTVEENLKLTMKDAKSTIPKNYLESFHPKLSMRTKLLVGQLSGGEQQSLTLALACLAHPKILLLDEHTSALDPHAAERLMRITANKVQEQGITCLLTTHNLALAVAYGNRLIALKQGKIIRDFSTSEKLKLSIQNLKAECYA